MKGLNSNEVEELRKLHGDNTIKESEPTTFWDEFKETFKDPMIKVLLAIVVIMMVMFALGYAEIYEPLGTLVAVLIVAFVTAKTGVASDQAYRNTKASIKKALVKVYRDDKLSEVIIDDIVVGDYILLQSGDKVPADGILVDGKLSVDNSALNGESEDCKKSSTTEDAEFPEDITGDTFVDASSIFRGTVVTDGEGIVKVKKVGMSTMMGKMAAEMDTEEPDSPLRVKLNKLAHQISVFGYIGAIVIALFMMGYNILVAGGFSTYFGSGVDVIIKDLISAVSLAIVIIVCAVPEGLPLMISLVLMQNTSKMLAHNVLVRKAIGIETAGSLNILFSDKTGTITKGQLDVVDFFLGDGESVDFKLIKHKSDVDLSIARNTQALFDSEHKVVGGNPTDKALLKFLGENTFASLSNVKVDDKQDFTSVNKFSQASINNKTYYKGAPEKLLANAKKYVDGTGKIKDLDLSVLNKKIDELAERSMRVLAFGYSNSKLTENTVNSDIIITGLVGIRDDVRDDAKEAIAKIKGAGVQLVMVTGDRLETARAIARDAGLLTGSDDVVITSAQLNEMSDDDVKAIIPRLRVVARALPTDKSRLVRLSQELNLVAGMTGDGRLCPVL